METINVSDLNEFTILPSNKVVNLHYRNAIKLGVEFLAAGTFLYFGLDEIIDMADIPLERKELVKFYSHTLAYLTTGAGVIGAAIDIYEGFLESLKRIVINKHDRTLDFRLGNSRFRYKREYDTIEEVVVNDVEQDLGKLEIRFKSNESEKTRGAPFTILQENPYEVRERILIYLQ